MVGRFQKHQHPPFFSKMRTFPEWSDIYCSIQIPALNLVRYPERSDIYSDTSPSSVLFGGCGDVPKKVRVFGLKKLFLKRFTVRSTTRTLITDKNDHSAFTAIIWGGCGGVPKQVRVFGSKTLFLKHFTVRSTTRTFITDKNDHSAFTAICDFSKIGSRGCTFIATGAPQIYIAISWGAADPQVHNIISAVGYTVARPDAY
jgi:hypothetical protein